MTDDPSRSSTSSDERGTDSPADRTQQLHRHLEATAEVPIDRETNRWLGEAEAVARDIATSDLDDATIRERVEKIRRLLSEVDDTGHDDADEHLAAAKAISAEILESES